MDFLKQAFPCPFSINYFLTSLLVLAGWRRSWWFMWDIIVNIVNKIAADFSVYSSTDFNGVKQESASL